MQKLGGLEPARDERCDDDEQSDQIEEELERSDALIRLALDSVAASIAPFCTSGVRVTSLQAR